MVNLLKCVGKYGNTLGTMIPSNMGFNMRNDMGKYWKVVGTCTKKCACEGKQHHGTILGFDIGKHWKTYEQLGI